MEGISVSIPASLPTFALTRWTNPAAQTPHSAFVYPPGQNKDGKMNLTTGSWFWYKTFALQLSEKKRIYQYAQWLDKQGYLSMLPFFSEKQKAEFGCVLLKDEVDIVATKYVPAFKETRPKRCR